MYTIADLLKVERFGTPQHKRSQGKCRGRGAGVLPPWRKYRAIVQKKCTGSSLHFARLELTQSKAMMSKKGYHSFNNNGERKEELTAALFSHFQP